MQNINIEATSSTPQVNFDVSGRLMMKGRSLILNVKEFYGPLNEWISNLNCRGQ